MAIKLQATRDGGWHRFTVNFSTEDQALAYIERKRGTVDVWGMEDSNIPDDWTRLWNELHPTCHHGMEARMCMDPYGDHHFGTAEQECQHGGW